MTNFLILFIQTICEFCALKHIHKKYSLSLSREDFTKAVNKILESFDGITKLNEHQDDALFHLVLRRDVFAILPTGFGKSVIFQLLPALCQELLRMGYSDFPDNAIINICPLVALVESHMYELKKRGISCVHLSGSEVSGDKKAVIDGKYSFIFVNPESIIINEK